MTPDRLCRLLAEPDRLRVYAAVVLGASTPAAIGEQTALSARTVAGVLRRLTAGGLIAATPEGLAASHEVFKSAVRAYASAERAAEPLDPDRRRDAVLRAFIADGRLKQIPAAHGKRRVVLEHIAASFEPGVGYAEPDVDVVLRVWYDDYVSLRRYLVDEQLMSRSGGVYWRTGGPVDVP
jgi:hypothetical protein